MALTVILAILTYTTLSCSSNKVSSQFPISQFYNTTSINTTLFRNYLCNDGEQGHSTARCCSCIVEECQLLGTCCVDALWKPSTPLDEYKKVLIDNGYIHAKQCQPLLPTLKDNVDHPWYIMADSCNQNASSLDTEGCRSNHTLYHQIPVIAGDKLFRNSFCAKCSGHTVYQHVEIVAKCSTKHVFFGSNITLNDVESLATCSFSVIHDINKAVRCERPYLNHKCKDIDDAALCMSYKGTVFSGHRNLNCLFCETGSITNTNVIEEIFTDNDACINEKKQEESDDFVHNIVMVADSKKHTVHVKLLAGFPIQEYFGHDRDSQESFEDFHQYFCHSSVKPCCSCVYTCLKSKDCCVDFLWDATKMRSLEQYLNYFTERSMAFPEKTCEPVFPPYKYMSYKESARYKMVTSCAIHATDLDKKYCFQDSSKAQSPQFYIPVYDSSDTIYKNMFCARCNFKTEYKFMDLKLECETTEDLEYGASTPPVEPFTTLPIESFTTLPVASSTTKTVESHTLKSSSNKERLLELTKQAKCRYKAHTLQGSYFDNDSCYSSNSQHRNCPYTNKNFNLCRLYKGTINYHRNFHCYKCADGDVTQLSTSRDTFHDCNAPITTRSTTTNDEFQTTFTTEETFHTTSLPTQNFFLIIKFAPDNNDGNVDTTITCDHDFIFDELKQKCIPFVCPDGFYAKNKDCFQPVITEESRNLAISANGTLAECLVSINSTLFMRLGNRANKTWNSLTAIRKYFNASAEIVQYFDPANKTIIYKVEGIVTAKILQNITEELSKSNSHIWSDMIDIVIAPDIKAKRLTHLYGFNLSHIFPNNKVCFSPVSLEQTNTTFTNTCGISYQNQTLSFHQISAWISFSNRNSRNHITICNQFHFQKSCATTTLNSSAVTFRNNTIFTEFGNKSYSYKPEDYLPTANGYSICVTKTDHVTTTQNIHSYRISQIVKASYILTLAGTPVSFICYLWIIVKFWFVRTSRSIPNFTFMCMCVCLMVSDIIIFVSIEIVPYPITCTVLGVILHWTLLCSFAWSTVIVIGLVRKFKSVAMTPEILNRKKMRRFTAIALPIPTAIVVLAVSLDRTGTVDVGYGGEKVCWMSNLYPRLAFYVIPVGIVSLLSAIALIYVIVMISKQQKISAKILNKKKHSNVKIALKLVAILGVSELFGYVQLGGGKPNNDQELFNTSVGLLYIIIRSFRGFFIWLALEGNNRVLASCFSKVTKRNTTNTTTSNVSSNNTKANTGSVSNIQMNEL